MNYRSLLISSIILILFSGCVSPENNITQNNIDDIIQTPISTPEPIQTLSKFESIYRDTDGNLHKVTNYTSQGGSVYNVIIKENIEKISKITPSETLNKNTEQNIKSSVIDNALKSVGIKEYTHEELVNKIEIINPGMDEGRIRGELQKTDDNILKYIKSIEVHNSNSVYCGGDKKSIGCSLNYYPPYEHSSEIDIVYSNFWISINSNSYMCSSFEYTLNHEIGHTYGATISENDGHSESFADNYASKHTSAFQRC